MSEFLLTLYLQQESELQRQTNTEPGAVATGSSYNKLISNDHGPGRYSPFLICRPMILSIPEPTKSLLLPVPYSWTHDARLLLTLYLQQESELQRQTNTEPGAVATGSSYNKL
ncbi:MAG TPA: hypothetical protein VGJ48_01550, partial [Pyrinomonadaceae bacterium]